MCEVIDRCCTSHFHCMRVVVYVTKTQQPSVGIEGKRSSKDDYHGAESERHCYESKVKKWRHYIVARNFFGPPFEDVDEELLTFLNVCRESELAAL